eukprot:gene8203-5728_t
MCIFFIAEGSPYYRFSCLLPRTAEHQQVGKSSTRRWPSPPPTPPRVTRVPGPIPPSG